MSHHLVEAKELHFSYPDGNHVLKGITFLITHGESVAVVGANGAGKSTLLHHLNGYFLPDNGSLVIGDVTLTKKTVSLVRRSVGMVFQNPDDQLFMPTVFDDVAFGPLNMGMSEEDVKRKVKSALAAVRSEHLRDRPPYRLSGGEKRSVAIASVLSMAPDILVMDEPSSNLDPKSRRLLIDLLKTFEHTKIIATHDLDLALDLCERTIVLSDGKILADGETSELFKNVDLLTSGNLEMPLRLQQCPVCGSV
ncbi:MAG: energy-coupling factor ABC transporter ATP-binding protein [Proteobacteria bacterium]|nr:energy-coupling factor ABC transporter ATP-binding protein [Pseudomonadota bacterium]